MNVYEVIFFSLWLINVVIHFSVRKIIKNRSMNTYKRFYSKSFLDNSIHKSLVSAKFSLNSKMWKDISDPLVIKCLKIQRTFTLLFYAYVFITILAFFVKVL